MNETILIVEDDPMQREMLGTLLHRKLNCGAVKAENGRKALDILADDQNRRIRLAILDLNMPEISGMEVLEHIRANYPSIAVVMLTGSKDIDDAVEALKAGATDYITKPYEGPRMVATIKNALRLTMLSHEVSRLKSEKDGRFGFDNMIGYDAGLRETVALARKAAAADIPVLISGETGTGKEVLARAIHGESARAGQDFIAVNCGAIPAQLVESTLFGHEKGAFTGATEKTAGKFREADGGTIFLDEIGELPLDAQVKLLRVLQQKEVEPVGAAKPVGVNLRVISATNRTLQEEVQAGRFREDLFFRLNVLTIDLPPLRARRSDIPALAAHFLTRFNAENQGPPRSLSPEALQLLKDHAWPGNVRELENVIKRALVTADTPGLGPADLSAALGQSGAAGAYSGPDTNLDTNQATAALSDISPALSVSLLDNGEQLKSTAAIEREVMQKALDHFQGNITRAAKALGMAKSTFYKKMKDF